MIRAGQDAPELLGPGSPATTLDGEPLQVKRWAEQGPVLLVFLRGFS